MSGLHGGQNSIEPVVILLQSFAQHVEPLIHGIEARRSEAAWAFRAVDTLRDQSGFFEHFEMLRDCWLSHLKGLSEFHYRGFTVGEARENRTTRWISECRERSIESC